MVRQAIDEQIDSVEPQIKYATNSVITLLAGDSLVEDNDIQTCIAGISEWFE